MAAAMMAAFCSGDKGEEDPFRDLLDRVDAVEEEEVGRLVEALEEGLERDIVVAVWGWGGLEKGGFNRNRSMVGVK